MTNFQFPIYSEKKRKHGFTLVEVLVTVAVFVIIAIAFFSLFNSVLKFIQFKRVETQAANLATEQMEVARNMPYADVGTVSGIPPGIIPQTQTITRDNVSYTVDTDIRYVDDPYDGLLGGIDAAPTDYKKVKLTVSWDTIWGDGSIAFVSIVSPKGLETSASVGALRILVFDSNGIPIPQAEVDVENADVGVSIINAQTDDNGVALFTGVPPSIALYKITVDKAGYSQSRTYGVDDPTGNVTPNPLHLSVFDWQTTQAGFAIDRTSVLTITTELINIDPPTIPVSLPFSIHGAKVVGQDGGGVGIYKYNASFSTEASGAVTISPLEWDGYTITFNESVIGFNLIQYSPPTNDPISILPNTSVSISFLFQAPYEQYSLLVSVTDETDLPLTVANVRLVGGGGGYDHTEISSGTGQSFFAPLAETDYNINITKTGYNPIDLLNFPVNGNNEVKLQMFPT
ncbi:MAG: hypothetical protein A2249_01310 [Candidatus Jacksonbacteria bacterium RIFOXYA2_FULL_44_7]|nr:MAG: hypothetical protein UW40_C0049G0001 [Parcubacteria group bacterium GW2011_GWF2_44_17]OGY70405.1 MAG: hypothetical protein A3E05_00855 [Candidatus Jacksonbacteria bacterium RIFCSPHIGHO2_12_FULL_44_12]OGY71179.1 MAG: hypothetical protein A3C00_01255 [Candidatus Jacksonbacteria bacterium RIFCSPHIGHO2_02_FULL_44_25]OGY75029.1 MAG: hypothetical protein A3H07_03680 [Candidatus Jacksonbacteria bacterium RIFCSPLOWO2_12_FULL_44_15b]OGY77630.1 MAG: hypothetical protein A2249_01310 [Candidatus Ja